MSTEGSFFRPVAQAYLRTHKERGPIQPPKPSFVFDLVQQAHGAIDRPAEPTEQTQPPEEPREDEGKPEQRLPIRPRLRPRGGDDRPSIPASAASVAAKDAPAVSASAASVAPVREGATGTPTDDPAPEKPQRKAATKATAPAAPAPVPLRMEVVERAAPAEPKPLSIWVAQGAAIEGHVVGFVAKPVHQQVEELLETINNRRDGEGGLEAILEGGEALGEEAEEEEDGTAEARQPQPQPWRRQQGETALAPETGPTPIEPEDELGWAPSTEIDLSALPSVVDEDFFMQVSRGATTDTSGTPT